jgi:hypothetical protein
MRRAAAQRLSATPTFGPLLALPPPEIGHDRSPKTIAEVLPALRQWSPFRPADSPSVRTFPGESDAPAYQEAVKLYFEAVAKAQDRPPKKPQ